MSTIFEKTNKEQNTKNLVTHMLVHKLCVHKAINVRYKRVYGGGTALLPSMPSKKKKETVQLKGQTRLL